MSTDTIEAVLSTLLLEAAHRSRGLLVGDQQLRTAVVAKAIHQSLNQFSAQSLTAPLVEQVVYQAVSNNPPWDVAKWQDTPFRQTVRALATEILRVLAQTHGNTPPAPMPSAA